MKSRHSVLHDIENKINAKSFLEFAVHLLESGYFNPIVFCHDRLWFDAKRYPQVMIGFINLLSYLYSCGLTIETTVSEPNDFETMLYRNIMRDKDITDIIRSYELTDVDFLSLDLKNAKVPENCEEDDFTLVKLYLVLRSGAALNRKSIESLIGRNLTDMFKRNDNSYEMR